VTDRRDVALAIGLALCALAAYIATLPPSYGVWDTAELQTVSAILGIAHPPGCPAFVLLGYAFSHLLPFGDAAWRVNAMCSCAVAASVGLLYCVARRFEIGAVPAAVCALGFALADVPWSVATHAEIQDVALVFRVLALWFALRWFDDGKGRDLFVAALCFSLAVATHGIALLLLPALALPIVGRKEFRSLRSIGLAAAGLTLGLLPYAYVPLRSAFVDAHQLDPVVGVGLPAGTPFWNYGDPSTPANFIHFVTGADFHVAGGFAGFVDLFAYPHFAAQLGAQIANAYGWLGAMLALLGAFLLLRSGRLDRIAIVVAALLPVPYTESYTDLEEPSRYYLLTVWCAAIAIGFAFEYVVALFELQKRSVGRYVAAAALAISFTTTAPDRVQLLAQRNDTFGPDFTKEVRGFVPDNAILLVAWGYATPLAYASYVEGSFGNRIVVPASAMQYLPYLPGSSGRPLYEIGFDSDLQLPGWKVTSVKRSTYFAYRISK
jgi:Protein of unknown function (DUF2723)